MFTRHVKDTVRQGIDCGERFAVFRFPGDDVFHIAGEAGYTFLVHEFGGKFSEAVDIRDFRQDRQPPEKCIEIAEHEKNVREVIRRHKELGYGKTVLSYVQGGFTDSENIIERLERFFNLNRENFCFVMQAIPGQLWVSATPELLLEYKNGTARTIALAGTRPHGESPEFWDDKNRNEQKIVTDYIVSQWRSIGLDVRTGEPHTVKSCNLEHICTDISAEVGTTHTVADLIDAIYPTPAVLGYPVDFAKKNIADFENHKRNFYSGYVVVNSPDGVVRAYVILRCACIDVDSRFSLNIYAGGGITAESDAVAEVVEVHNKACVLSSVLVGESNPEQPM